MIDVRRLAMLREVALRGSLMAAARSMELSSSAISQQLSRFERELGVVLLEPVGRGVQLTPIAQALVARTDRVLQELEEAESELTASRDGLAGVLRLATFSTFAFGTLPTLLTQLSLAAPRLRVEFVQLDPERALEELSMRRVDLAIIDEYPGIPLNPGRGLFRSHVTTEAIALYLPDVRAGERNNDATLVGLPTDPARLADLPWVFEPAGTEAHHWARSTCRALGFDPNVRFESPDPHVHRRLVESGVAAAFLPDHVAREAERPLRRTHVDTEGMERRVYTTVRSGTERRPAVALGLATIAAVYSTHSVAPVVAPN